MTLRDPVSVPWGVLEDTLAARRPPRDHWKSFRKKLEFRRFLESPLGVHAFAGARLPALHKTHIFAKSSILLQRGANFQFLDFGTPLE